MMRIYKATGRKPRLILAITLSLFLLAGALPSLKIYRAEAVEQVKDEELYQALLDLTNPWTVMCVAAHPDDEDGATLTVLRRKMGVHTVTLFSTYGEGGQNAVGPELYEELGAIRARETEEASRIQGSEAHFLGLKDFGFSKSAEEAFRIWGHEEALRRMVLKIRELRPDVIITNHDTVGGHGHHQATGRLVVEAFDAAADPARFPEQLRGGRLQPWQAQRLFVRFSFSGESASRSKEDEAARAGRVVTIDRNERDPVRGTSYAEQALQALRRHASQGPWPQALPPQGWPPVRYRLAREALMATPLPASPQSLLDELHLPLETMRELVPLASRAVLALYLSPNANRESVLRALVSLRRNNIFKVTEETKEKHRFRLMNERLDRALAAAAKVSAEIEAEEVTVLTPGMRVPFRSLIHNMGESPLEIKETRSLAGGRQIGSHVGSMVIPARHTRRTQGSAYVVPQNAKVNVPQSEHLYDGRLFGEELSERITLEVEGAPFTITASRRFNIAPAVEIESISPRILVVTPQTFQETLPFTFRYRNHTKADVDVRLRPTELSNAGRANEVGWVRVPARGTIKNEVGLRLSLNHMKAIKERGELNTTERFTIERVSRPRESSPPITEREVKIVYADARIPKGLRVGYVRSYDFTLTDALAALGVEARELTADEISKGDLGSYSAIIIDNRGYQAHPELIAHNQRLLDYAKEGGTLIVFYHKTNEWNPDPKANRPQLAPYPILLGNSRVTDEDAPVEFTDPIHPLLNYPNKISEEDFRGWIQERGLYFPREWDKQYTAPLAMKDAGEPLLKGGLLAAEYGRGRYIYTSLVWYRQLREGVPGAYRMLANMISYGREGKESR